MKPLSFSLNYFKMEEKPIKVVVMFRDEDVCAGLGT